MIVRRLVLGRQDGVYIIPIEPEVCVVLPFPPLLRLKNNHVMQAFIMSTRFSKAELKALSLSKSEIGLAHTLPKEKRFVPETTIVSRNFFLCNLSIAYSHTVNIWAGA